MRYLSSGPLSATPVGYSTGSGGSNPDPHAAEALHSVACVNCVAVLQLTIEFSLGIYTF